MTPTEFFTSPLGIGIVMTCIGFAVALRCYLEIAVSESQGVE